MHVVISRLVGRSALGAVLGVGLYVFAMPATSAPHDCAGQEGQPVAAATITTPQAPVGAGWG